MDELDKIFADTESIKQRLERELLDATAKTNKVVYSKLEKMVLKLNSKAGILSLDESSKKFLIEIEKTIFEAMKTSGYNAAVGKFTRDFNYIDKNVKKMHKVASNIDVNLSRLSDIQQGEITNTIDRLLGNNMNANFVNPLKETLYRHVAMGGTMNDAQKILKKYILGDKEIDPKLTRYVSQVSTDSVSQYEGAMQQKIAEEYEMNAIKYIGSLIVDSRKQCRKWASMKHILIKDLKKEIAWADSNGSGMVKNTTPETFMIYRGGYNCRHQAIPILVNNKE